MPVLKRREKNSCLFIPKDSQPQCCQEVLYNAVVRYSNWNIEVHLWGVDNIGDCSFQGEMNSASAGSFDTTTPFNLLKVHFVHHR
jgi:hypothetical protein